jgi:hypothetical protein
VGDDAGAALLNDAVVEREIVPESVEDEAGAPSVAVADIMSKIKFRSALNEAMIVLSLRCGMG